MMSDGGDAWVTVFRSTNEVECRQRSLVLEAIGAAHQVHRANGEFIIAVAATDAERSLAEWVAFAKENQDLPVVRPPIRRHGDGWAGVVCFVAVLLLVAALQHVKAFGVRWSALGSADADLIRGGEQWRAVTALTLHVDLVHLISNIVIGGLVGLFAGRTFGAGRAWCGILFAGALGNLLNAVVRPMDHTSVGASTAVFAAFGLLAASGWQQRQLSKTTRLYRWTPIVGGALLLSFLGTGGDRTDVGAHVFGFLCAIPFGVLFGLLDSDDSSFRRTQRLYGLAALSILAAAWACALGLSAS